MPADLVHRFLSAIGATALPSVGLLALAFALLAVEIGLGPRLAPAARKGLRLGALALGVGVGLLLAWRVLWLADDAFISFRYARNLAEGHGLVYNPGERVEGYTNFLWTAALGSAGWLGANVPHVALFGDLLAFVGVLLVTALAARRASPEGATIPFAALALAGSGAFAVWASSGLETMPAALLVVAAVWASTRSSALAGLFLALAALTRPDQVLLVGCMGLALVIEDLAHGRGPLLGRLDLRRYLRFSAPFLLLFVPWFLGRWAYYGDLFPNTYYAKSGGVSYPRQGWIYASVTLFSTGAWLFLPAFVAALLGRPRERNETRYRAFALLALLVFGGYVVKVGGDFMQNRFFVGLLPPVLIAAEVGLRWRWRAAATPGRAVVAGLGALALAGPWLPIELIRPGEKAWHVAAEESFYRLRSVFPISVAGKSDKAAKVRAVFTDRGLLPRLGLGNIGVTGYESRLPIVDVFGLTNRTIARKPIARRGRPGHEKLATTEELIAEGAEVGLDFDVEEPLREWSEASVGGLRLQILRFTPALIEGLRTVPGARVPDPWGEARRIAALESRDRVAAAARAYEVLVAAEHRDEVLAPLRVRLAEGPAELRERLAASPPTAALLRDADDLLPAQEAAVYAARFPARWTLDELPEGAELVGTAFGPGPVGAAIGRQKPVSGFRGSRFLNSYHGGDAETGRVALPPFVAGGQVSLLVGGGKTCSRTYAGIELDGRIVARACGRDDEVLRPAVLDTARWAGRSVRVVLVDEATGPWGHLLADDVIVEPAPSALAALHR